VLLASVPLDDREGSGLDEGAVLLVEHGRLRCKA
jgi:hypothetical protein